MRLRLDQLEALSWIAKLGSFRSAARQLRISQPAVSSRIRELERHLGFAVIDREGARPRVTPKGTEVVRYAEQMIGLAESLATHFDERPLFAGTIRMGAADTFALTHLSPLLARIAAQQPATHVELDIDFSANLNRKLHAGDLDIAFLTAPTASAAIAIEPLLDLDLAWLAGPKMALPKRPLTPADLVDVPILTNPRPSHLYRTIMDWFAGGGVVPRRLNTCTSLTIMAKLTAEGTGMSVLPHAILQRELGRGQLRRLRSNPRLPPHHMAVAYRDEPGRRDLRHVVAIARDLIDHAR
ncbi:MAG: LysR family transcriptional regulator [Alphaproteobacteria bacterium]|nr:LysR family transcriptional regulator [Alphaproteobacteria bacterium]